MKPFGINLVLALGLACGNAKADFVWPDVDAVAQAEQSNTASITIRTQNDHSIRAEFSITTKGNGTLELPGVLIGVYDSHDNGMTYRGSLLRCSWQQTSDHVLELEISGFAEFGSEKGQQPVATKPVRALLRYSPDKSRFLVAEKSPGIYVQERKGLPKN